MASAMSIDTSPDNATLPYSFASSSPSPPAAAASSASSSLSKPRPNEKEIDNLCLKLELAGVDVKREHHLRLLAENDWNWLKAMSAYANAQQADEEEKSDDNSDCYIEERKDDAGLPAFLRQSSSESLASASSSSSMKEAPAPVSTDPIKIAFLNDGGLRKVYDYTYGRALKKAMTHFEGESKRSLEYFYKGNPITPDMNAIQLGMTASDNVIHGNMPSNRKRVFESTLSAIAGANASSAASASSAAAAAAVSSAVIPSTSAEPSQKKIKLDSTSAGAAAAAAAAAASSSSAAPELRPSDYSQYPLVTPFKAKWTELIIGRLELKIRQPVEIQRPTGERVRSANPQTSYVSISAFFSDFIANAWSYRFNEDELTNAEQNGLIGETFQRLLNTSHALKCTFKKLYTDITCYECLGKDCTAHKDRNIVHTFHVAINLLPGANNQFLPGANFIFSLLHLDFKYIVNEMLSPMDAVRLNEGNVDLNWPLELAVRTKFRENGYQPSATAASSSSSSSRNRNSKALREERKDDMEMEMDSATRAAVAMSVVEQQRIRRVFGLPSEEPVEDLSCPATEHFLPMSLERFSEECDLNITLRDYQQQTVLWALKQECAVSMSEAYWAHLMLGGQHVWYSPFFQMIRFEPLPRITGGMICEEMGLGKTIDMLALMNLNTPEMHRPTSRPASLDTADETSFASSSSFIPISNQLISNRQPCKCTLVIAPTSLLGQWFTELSSKSKRDLKMLLWYSPNRTRDLKKIMEYDVIFTTPGVITNELGARSTKNKEKLSTVNDSPLLKLDFFRIIVDESHILKQRSAQQSMHIVGLHSPRRWLLTGTPISTNIDDIFSQFAFFHMPVLSHSGAVIAAARRYLLGKAASSDHITLNGIFGTVATMFTRNMMRHKKNQPFNGRPQLINLPSRTSSVIKVQFNHEERQAYDHLLSFARTQFDGFARRGQVVARTIQVMSLLLPLRQACSAGRIQRDEVLQRQREMEAIAVAEKAKQKEEDEALAAQQPFNVDSECSICLDVIEKSLMTPCRHVFCDECIRGAIRANHECPLCRKEVRAKELRPPPPRVQARPEVEPPAAAAASASAALSSPSSSEIEFTSKVDALLLHLRMVKRDDPLAKSLVFSQFSKTIETVQKRLAAEGFEVVVIEGSMSASQRSTSFDRFMNRPSCTVLLMSLRTGSVGLSLVHATHVFLLEPSLNPALTQQAINRVHRVGQTKHCYVHHLVVENSIEERIFERMEASMKSGSLAQDADVVDRQVGALKKDSYAMKLDELTALFK